MCTAVTARVSTATAPAPAAGTGMETAEDGVCRGGCALAPQCWGPTLLLCPGEKPESAETRVYELQWDQERVHRDLHTPAHICTHLHTLVHARTHLGICNTLQTCTRLHTSVHIWASVYISIHLACLANLYTPVHIYMHLSTPVVICAHIWASVYTSTPCTPVHTHMQLRAAAGVSCLRTPDTWPPSWICAAQLQSNEQGCTAQAPGKGQECQWVA